MKKFILAKKRGMSQVFKDDGTVVPVTIVEAQPNVVTQVRTKQKDGYDAIQVGLERTKDKGLTKPERGHLKDLPPLRHLCEFKPTGDNPLKRGDTVTVDIFEPGELVNVSGTSIGRGFQGVVKRHGFSGGPATHGHRHVLRAPGAIGGRFPQRTLKGKKMAGRMGAERVTVKNLEVIRVDKNENTIFLKGAVPGKKGTLLEIVSAAS